MRHLRITAPNRIAASVAIAAVLANVVLVALHAMAMAGRSPGNAARAVALPTAGSICGPARGEESASPLRAPANDDGAPRPPVDCAICSGALALTYLVADTSAGQTHAPVVLGIRFSAPSDRDRIEREPFETRSRGPPALA